MVEIGKDADHGGSAEDGGQEPGGGGSLGARSLREKLSSDILSIMLL